MELGLKGKVVLITGGSKGIGLACAQTFLRPKARGSPSVRVRAKISTRPAPTSTGRLASSPISWTPWRRKE